MLNGIIDIYRNAYRGLSRETWLLSLVMLINRSGTMVIGFMSVYVVDREGLGWTIAEAGAVMACFGAGSIAGAYFGGRITDRFGFYPLQIAALVSGGIMFIIVGYIHSFVPLCISVFLLSLCNESFRPANSTAIAWYSTVENRTRSYSLNRLAINLGWAAGGALGGILAEFNYQLLFWVDGITNISAAVLMMVLLPMVKHARPETVAQERDRSSPFKDGNYMLFTLMVVLFAVCFLQLFGMQSLFFKEAWKLSKTSIGLLMAINGLLIAFVEMILVYHLENRGTGLYYIRVGALLTGAGFLVVNFLPPGFGAALLALLFITIGEIFALPFMNSYWVSRTKAHNRGSYAAVYTMAWSAAHVIAPTFGSQLVAHAGFAVLWWMVGAVSVVVTLGTWWLERRTTNEKVIAVNSTQ